MQAVAALPPTVLVTADRFPPASRARGRTPPWRGAMVLGVGWLAFPPVLGAQEPGVLAEITSVKVSVRLEGAARGYPGLDGAALELDIRRRLEGVGLRVDDVGAGPQRGQSPVFTVLLVMYTDPARPRVYAFSLTATLTEGVTLRRGEGERVWAETWSAGSTVGMIGVDGAQILRDDLGEMVERFVREYRRANAEGRRTDRQGGSGRTVGLLPTSPSSAARPSERLPIRLSIWKRPSLAEQQAR